MLMAGSVCNDVNSADTPQDVIYSLHFQCHVLNVFHEFFGAVDVVGPITNMWLKYSCQFFGHLKGYKAQAGYYGPQENVLFLVWRAHRIMENPHQLDTFFCRFFSSTPFYFFIFYNILNSLAFRLLVASFGMC